MSTIQVIEIGEVIALGAAFTFGASNVLFRLVEDEFTPSQVNLFRTSLGWFAFAGVLLWQGSLLGLLGLSLELLGILILSAIFGQVLGDTIYFLAQKYIGTSIALPLGLTFPIWANFYAFVLLGDQVPPIAFIGLAFILAGVLVFAQTSREGHAEAYLAALDGLGSPPDKDSPDNTFLTIRGVNFSRKFLLGIGLAIIAANCWALGGVILDPALDTVTSMEANVVRFLPSIFMLWGLSRSGIFDGREKNVEPKPVERTLRSWGILFVGGVVGTVLGAWFFVEGIGLLGAAKASILHATSPLFATPLAVLLTKEKLTRTVLLASLITFFGILLVLL